MKKMLVTTAACLVCSTAFAQYTSVPFGSNAESAFKYVVWNNSGSGIGNSSWNYFFNTYSAYGYSSLLLTATFSDSTVLGNTPVGSSFCCMGPTASTTYGEVVTPPTSATLDSFSFTLTSGIGPVEGGVGVWNGPTTYGSGYGSPTNLYLSAPMDSGSGGLITFTPDVPLTAGDNYVLYITVGAAVPEPTTWVTMLIGVGLIGVALRSRRRLRPASSPGRGLRQSRGWTGR